MFNLEIKKPNSVFNALSVFPSKEIVNTEGFLIQGDFYQAEDGDTKNDFWSNLLAPKNPMLNYNLEMAREFITQHLVCSKLSSLTEFALFDGYVKQPLEFTDICRKLTDAEISQVLKKAPKKQFGLYMLESAEDNKKIVVRNVSGITKELTELTASLYITRLILEMFYQESMFNCQHFTDEVGNKVVANIDFCMDLALGLNPEEKKEIYSLWD